MSFGLIEQRLYAQFHAWLEELSDVQFAALAENWDNVMNDAALDRIDSWVIADRTIAEIRAARGEPS
jgi:hypothetical protein